MERTTEDEREDRTEDGRLVENPEGDGLEEVVLREDVVLLERLELEGLDDRVGVEGLGLGREGVVRRTLGDGLALGAGRRPLAPDNRPGTLKRIKVTNDHRIRCFVGEHNMEGLLYSTLQELTLLGMDSILPCQKHKADK